MKTMLNKLMLVAAVAVLATGFASPLAADDGNDLATINALCSAPWEVCGQVEALRTPATAPGRTPSPVATNAAANARNFYAKWCWVRNFQPDGTFTTDGRSIESGSWAIKGNSVVLTFADHTDTMTLPVDPDGCDGTDAAGSPVHWVQLPPQPRNATPEAAQRAAEVLGASQGSYVFVQGKEGAGRGLIVAMEKGNAILTKASFIVNYTGVVLKTLNQVGLMPGACSVAVGGDAMQFAAPAGAKPLTLMQDIDKNVAAGDNVMVLKCKNGEAVASPLVGQVIRVGVKRVEVNVQFDADDLGGPVIDLKTGSVIGIADTETVDYDRVIGMSYRVPIVHRYAVRLDAINGWQNVDWRTFLPQAAALREVEALTADLAAFLDKRIPTATPASATMRSNLQKYAMQTQSTSISQVTPEEQAQAMKHLITSLKAASQADVAVVGRQLTYDYFQKELERQQKARDAMAAMFDKMLEKFNP